ncbi:MAG: Ubiquinone biosynthesis O-methyltransferase [Candidatus Tokpelaia hoelldobleri]|uniref:Ubiquinone biosynthesis O-methyltransferase n=1 Tax=Candidatus Tokpelaia hoelldobleri TaxID=1902579 RepID=A0A1U9JT20_9HYPH|nr:MAG: Ubiquinone biosynthesis O-methyltransferase [Candidatus Tokpelaia hoelldoblerii]
MTETARTTIDATEVERFSRLAAQWWDPAGKFRPLHKFNPTRLAYIREKICAAFDREPNGEKPLKGLRVLDIGCGGGLLCEPLARLGAEVIGADASATNIEVAKIHAETSRLKIDYRATTAETLAEAGEKFDIVLNMEVVEHVADVKLFMSAVATMVKPGGLMFVATLNRTLKARALAIFGAEYILRWLPKGTHTYEKFLRPEELKKELGCGGLTVVDEIGVTYNPFTDSWNRSADMSVNYMLLARRLK